MAKILLCLSGHSQQHCTESFGLIWLDSLEKGQLLTQTETMLTFVGLQFWTLVRFGLTVVEEFHGDFSEVENKET